MHTRIRRSWLRLGALVAFGCQSSGGGDGGTYGTQGRVEFNYQQGCFFGCPLGQPLLVGSKQTISVSDEGDVEGVKVSGSKPKIADFALERACVCERADKVGGQIKIAEDASCQSPFRKHCDNSILVQGNAAGDTQLVLKDKSGALIDEVSVLVRDAADARVEASYPNKLGKQSTDTLELAPGGHVQVDVTLYDDMGRELLATSGVTWRVDDFEVAQVTVWLVGNGQEVEAGLSAEIDAKAAGETKLTISAPGHDQDVTVKVTAP